MMTLRITSNQVEQIVALAEHGVRKAVMDAIAFLKLSEHEAQRVIEHGGKLDEFFAESCISALKKLHLSDEFFEEQTESEQAYPPGYVPKDIPTQIHVLKNLFPEIGGANPELLSLVEEGKTELSFIADRHGYFAIPHWTKVAPTYGEAVKKVLNLLSVTRSGGLADHISKMCVPESLRESRRKADSMNELLRNQESDILIVQAGFGLRHRGRSPRRALAVMGENEFGLGTYETAIMLLTHPERFSNFSDLYAFAAGDELTDDTFHCCEVVPHFYCSIQGLVVSYNPINTTSQYYGSVSAFLPG